ncbi:VCBS repeat-containing protein [Streptomyces sp. SJL17-1]|uniref:FG-GAP repeat domain-containing protein n=1 Tax=Streptomyces sp. SJL17-1 TaxID=2967223 RepID=UPI00296728B6|nr:VCBS repeat-containing protein [Streptomyces sp. SJL17-1]
MNPTRTTRYRLAAAVAVALALTAGTASTAGAAPLTVTASPSQTVQQDGVLPFPSTARVVGAGAKGFFTVQTIDGKYVYQWTRYEDGATTTLDAWGVVARQTDVLWRSTGTVHTLNDIATGAEPVVIDTSVLGEGYVGVAATGSALVMTKANTTGGQDIHVVGKQQDTVVDRRVTGLPEDAVITGWNVDSPDVAVALYTGTRDGVSGKRAAVVDLTAGKVVEEYDTGWVTKGDTALSATHIVWIEESTSGPSTLVAVRRGTGETQRIPLSGGWNLTVDLVGDWLTYGQRGGYDAYNPNPLYALTARSLTTGDTVKLLDDYASTFPGPDGTQMVRGGTVADGEGLYRISVGADGTPVTRLVASTGIPTAYSVVSQNVPTVIDFDRAPGPVSMTWTLSRSRGSVRVELVHDKTGKAVTLYDHGDGPSTRTVTWDGTFVTRDISIPAVYTVPAPNGDYTWRMTGRPENGIGPVLEKTGTFKVVRKTVPHDFNDNGTPDLLVREDDGRLSLYNTSHPLGSWTMGKPESLGTGGWNAYDRLLTPGDLGGAPYADVLGRDRTGVLWLHQGTGHALASRTKIGGGWQVYDKLTGGSDLNGDGRTDLLSTDKAGVLWLYKGTGSATAPFATRVKVGGGWGAYNQLTATGNIGGGPAGDLVARDASGVLWLYLGRGDGTFAARTRIGGGWGTYGSIVAIGDVDRDGRPDLLATAAGDGTPYIYKGTGDWRAPFGTRSDAYSYAHLDPANVF